MADENKSNDPNGTEKPVDQKDNNGSNAQAHWQKIADERYNEIEKLKQEKNELLEKTKNTETEELRNRLRAIENEKTIEMLTKKYPDIEPNLLLGKEDSEIENLVENQRKRTKTYLANTIDINAPQYTQKDIDQQIDTIKKSNKTPIEKAQEVLKLNRLSREQ